MGRLIDGDKVIKDMLQYYHDCEQTSVYTKLGFETAIEVVKNASPVDAIPKIDYEARLKADMVDIFDELRAKIEIRCGLIKEDHCKLCYHCHTVMGVREILEVIDKYKYKLESEVEG